MPHTLTTHNEQLFLLQLCFLGLQHLQLPHQLILVGDAQVHAMSAQSELHALDLTPNKGEERRRTEKKQLFEKNKTRLEPTSLLPGRDGPAQKPKKYIPHPTILPTSTETR